LAFKELAIERWENGSLDGGSLDGKFPIFAFGAFSWDTDAATRWTELPLSPVVVLTLLLVS